jgi:dTDP-4-dehydrorhamnose 3,5-epimerase
MIFIELPVHGAYLINMEKHADARGFFARTWCQQEFEQRGLVSRIVQSNTSFTTYKGTLRGLHYQLAPYAETKLVRCIRGAIYDVIIDLRCASSTYMQWVGVKLAAATNTVLHVPEGYALGFQTLEDDTEVTYQVSQCYAPPYERGVRYDDPLFEIEWPLAVEVISDKDKSWPDYAA